MFVLAHEMLHLALRTHDRARGADRTEFNYAHDYIINDILRAELGQAVPAGGLDMPGARDRSAEEIVLEMRRNAATQTKTSVWEGEATSARRLFGAGHASSWRHRTARPATSSTPGAKPSCSRTMRRARRQARSG